MLSVEQSLRALRREILGALAADAPLPGGVELVADRVTVSLALQLQSLAPASDAPGKWGIATEPGSGPAHQLTLEFKVQKPFGSVVAPPAGPAPTLALAPESAMTTTAESPHFAALAEVFGAPGFDSAARATVFRETLEELSEAERKVVLGSLGSSGASGIEPQLHLARHLVLRLAGSGPAGPKAGPERLRQLAERAPVAELIRLAAEKWRTQSEWAAAAPPPRDS